MIDDHIDVSIFFFRWNARYDKFTKTTRHVARSLNKDLVTKSRKNRKYLQYLRIQRVIGINNRKGHSPWRFISEMILLAGQ